MKRRRSRAPKNQVMNGPLGPGPAEAPPVRRSGRAHKAVEPSDAAGDGDVAEDAAHNIFGTGPGRQRAGKQVITWANRLLDTLLDGAACPTTRAAIDALAPLLEAECDDKIRNYKHLFNISKCREVIEARAQGKSRSGAAIGSSPAPRGSGRLANSSSRRSQSRKYDEAAVLKRGIREEQSAAASKATEEEEDARLQEGEDALLALNAAMEGDAVQIPPRLYDEARDLHHAASAAIFPLVALKLKSQEGRELTGRLQDGINALKKKARGVEDWPSPAPPPGYVFIASQESGHGSRAAAELRGASDSGKRARGSDGVKRPVKALSSAKKRLEKQVMTVASLGDRCLDVSRGINPDFFQPRFENVNPDEKVSDEEASAALKIMTRYMLQTRQEIAEDDIDELGGVAIYAYTSMAGLCENTNVSVNADPFLQRALSTLITARHESPPLVNKNIKKRGLYKKKAPKMQSAAAAADDDDNDDDDDDDCDGDGDGSGKRRRS